MADEKSMGLGAAKSLTTYHEDEAEQAVVLRQVLELHPEALTQNELIREITAGGSSEFTDTDAVQRAVRDLVGTGLLHSLPEDELVRPTRAAVRYFELSEGAG